MITDNWPDGEAQWWWKYVRVASDVYWAQVVAGQTAAQVADPEPQPWRQNVAQILTGVALLNAAATQRDAEVQANLQREGVEQIKRALEQVGS